MKINDFTQNILTNVILVIYIEFTQWKRSHFFIIFAGFFFCCSIFFSLDFFVCNRKVVWSKGRRKKIWFGHHLSCFCANSLCFLSNLFIIRSDLNSSRIAGRPVGRLESRGWRTKVSDIFKRSSEMFSNAIRSNEMLQNLNKHIFDGHRKTVHN